MTNSKVGIVIINYNNYLDTMRCIKSLNNQTYMNKYIVVIDNNSTNSSTNYIKTNSSVKLIENEKNYGFAFACNQGIRNALRKNCEYIWILNNDTTHNNNCLELMVKYYDNGNITNIACIGSLILESKNRKKIQYLGGGYLNLNLGIRYNLKKPSKKLNYITGASMLIHKNYFSDVGFFDERYFMYFEDSDWCYRAIELGYKLYVEPKAIIFHEEGASFGDKQMVRQKYIIDSLKLYMDKHSRFPKLSYFLSIILRLIKSLLTLNFKKLVIMLKVLFNN